MAAQLIGRQHELAGLAANVAEVAGGGPVAVLLTGLPGVGKTSLARAALDLAATAGFAAFAGRAHPLSHDVAYAPLVEAFGAPLREMDEPRRAAVIGDLPQLGLLFSGLGLAAPAPLGDPALEGSRLLDGLVRLAERLSREQPLAVLLDDIHAADPATVAFVARLAAIAADRAILLLLTARPDEPGQGRIAQLSTALSASGWQLTHHVVQPLDCEQARSLVRSVLGGGVDPRLVARIVERCAGRPLFLDAVARTVAESGRLHACEDGTLQLSGDDLPLPEGVRAQLQARLAGAAAGERDVLDLLAVAGDDLDYDLIVAATDLPPDEVVAALDRLHHRGLLAGSGSPSGGTRGHGLVHGLLRDVLLEELSPIADQRAHARLAIALAERDRDDPRLPEHALAAGPLLDPDSALEHLIRGGRHAHSLGATDAKARYLAAAVDIALRRDRGDLLAELQDQLGDALRRTGRRAEAQACWQAVLARYRDAGEPMATARIEQELGMLAWSGGDLEVARAHFDSAEQALAGLEPSAAHAELLYSQMITASRIGDAETVARTARGLRELAGQLDSPTLQAQAYLAEAVLDYAATDYVTMVENNVRALAAAERSGDPLLIIRAHDQLSVAAASELDLAALRTHSQASLRAARELGAPILEPWPKGRLAVTDLLGGDWDAALRTTSEMITLADRYDEQRGAVSAAAGHAWILVHRGRLPDAQRILDRARHNAKPMLERDRNVFSIVALAEATLALAQDDPRRAVERGGQLTNSTGGWLPLLGLAVLGEAHARCGNEADAHALADRLRSVRSCTTVAPEALASWVGGLADAQAGRSGEAAGRLRAAAAAFDSLGLPFLTARAQLAAASAEAADQAADAVAQARAALHTFDGLGAPLQAQQARELLRKLGVVASRGRGRRETGTPLSARELEVARLVASGLSNADVATALFISPRTVSTHLDRIYARLQLSSRVALTRYLADSGLLDADGSAAQA